MKTWSWDTGDLSGWWSWETKTKQVGWQRLSSVKSENTPQRETRTDLDGLVGVSDESNEQAEHHVDEEGDVGVEVESAEEPHGVALVPHLLEGAVHVVSVDEREEAFCHLVKCSELESVQEEMTSTHTETNSMWRWQFAYFVVVRPEHDPAAEAVSKVDHGGATAEADHVWERCPQG